MREKLKADALLYDTEKKRIMYMLFQTSDVLFAGMKPWFESNEDGATLNEFFEEAKYFTEVYCLKADAK